MNGCPGGSAKTHCPVHGYNTGRCNPAAPTTSPLLSVLLRAAARKHELNIASKGSRITPDGQLMLDAAAEIDRLTSMVPTEDGETK